MVYSVIAKQQLPATPWNTNDMEGMRLIMADPALTLLRLKFKIVDKITDGSPLLTVDNGKPLEKRMKKCKVDAEMI